jgi:hypothetical protein
MILVVTVMMMAVTHDVSATTEAHHQKERASPEQIIPKVTKLHDNVPRSACSRLRQPQQQALDCWRAALVAFTA